MDRDLAVGVGAGVLIASLCLNIYLFISKNDPDLFPMVYDRVLGSPPSIEPMDHVMGPGDGAFTIVEFADYQCAYCRQMNEDLKRLVEKYPAITWVKRHRPITTHRYAEIASQAAECADEQAAFWAYNDALFEWQPELSEPQIFVSIAGRLGLDREQFGACFRAGKYGGKITKDLLSARDRGIGRTPTLYINGARYDEAVSFDELERIVRQHFEAEKESENEH